MWGRPESTALGSDKGFDDLSSASPRFVSLGPRFSEHLRALASCSGEKFEMTVLMILLASSHFVKIGQRKSYA